MLIERQTIHWYEHGDLREALRFSFNGKENDNEVKGEGNQQDYGFRIYDPRLAKFLSVDPLSKNYPWYTPYQFAGNTPIQAIDLDGMEEYLVIHWMENGQTKATSLVRLIDDWKVDVNSKEVVYSTMDYKFYSDFVQKNPNNSYTYNADFFYNKYLENETNRKPLLDKKKSQWETDFRKDEKAMITEGITAVSPSTNMTGFQKGRAIHTLPLSPEAVQFKTKSAELTEEGKKELDNLVYDMKLVPNSTYTLEGHTDNVGSPMDNLKLSQNRADASKNYLISQGIDASRITTKSLGDTKPKADNSSDSGRSKNRRIEMKRDNVGN